MNRFLVAFGDLCLSLVEWAVVVAIGLAFAIAVVAACHTFYPFLPALPEPLP